MSTASALAERFFHVPLVPKRIVMSMYCLQFKKYWFFFFFLRKQNTTQNKKVRKQRQLKQERGRDPEFPALGQRTPAPALMHRKTSPPRTGLSVCLREEGGARQRRPSGQTQGTSGAGGAVHQVSCDKHTHISPARPCVSRLALPVTQLRRAFMEH